jgi:hypothetical protein
MSYIYQLNCIYSRSFCKEIVSFMYSFEYNPTFSVLCKCWIRSRNDFWKACIYCCYICIYSSIPYLLDQDNGHYILTCAAAGIMHLVRTNHPVVGCLLNEPHRKNNN